MHLRRHLVLVLLICTVVSFTYIALAYSRAEASRQDNPINEKTNQKASTSSTIQAASIEETATPVKEADAKVPSKFLINNNFVDPDNNCEFCTRIVYNPGKQGEAGLAYKDDKLNVGDSQRIVLFAKGMPGEQVSFVAAGNDTIVPGENDSDIFPKIDFSVVTKNVTLDNNWQRFEISLNSSNVTDANYPFGVQLTQSKNKGPLIFYLKGVSLDSKPAMNPLSTLNVTGQGNTTKLTVNIHANSTNSTVAPATIEFKANATGGLAPYLFSWNFGGGGSSNSSNNIAVGQTVSHTFTEAGLYNITLAAKDSGTPSQNASASVIVTVESPANTIEPLTARIDTNSTNDNNTTAPATIEFKANATGGLAPYLFSWNFGGGGSSNSSNNIAVGQTVSHTFTEAGLYNITLAAKDSGTPSQNASASVIVLVKSPANTTDAANMESSKTKPEPLTARMDTNSTNDNNTTAPATIEFKANATGGLAPYLFSWNFGDGDGGNTSTGVGQTVLHTFTQAGHYNITLAAKDSGTPIQNASANVIVTIASSVNTTEPLINTNNASSVVTNSTNNASSVVTNSTNNASGVVTNSTNNASSVVTNSTNNAIITAPTTEEFEANSTAGSELSTNTLIQNASANATVSVASPTNITGPIDSGTKPLATKIDDNTIASHINETLKESKQQLSSSNHAPKLDDQRIIVDPAKAAEIILKAADPDKDPIRFEIVRDPSHGTLAGLDKQKGTVSYITNPGLWGSDSFKFRVVDNHNAESRDGTVSIKFKTSRNAPPNVADVIVATATDKPLNIDLKASGTDKRELLKFAVTSNPLHGKLRGPVIIDQTSVKITYLPNKDYEGKDIFGFKAERANGVSSRLANVTVMVVAPPPTPNSLPKADTQSIYTDQDKKIGIVLRGTDTEGEKLTFSLITEPSHGNIISFDSSSGKLIYKPDAKFSGDDSFTFRVTDPKGGTSNDAKVSLKVNSLDNIPTKEKVSHLGESVRSRSENTSSFVHAEAKNHRPSADAGPNNIVYSGTKDVTLAGSGKDKDGDKLSYLWKQISGPPIALMGMKTNTPIFNAPEVIGDTLIQFLLTVNDGKGGQDTDFTNVLVKNLIEDRDLTALKPLVNSLDNNNQTELIGQKKFR